MTNEQKKAWDGFCKEQQLDNYLPFVRNLVWVAWRKAFDMGYRLASEDARKDTRGSDDPRYIPGSAGAMTGCIREVDEASKSAFGISILAMVISATAFIVAIAGLSL